jgi:hypothetical protein
VIECDYRRLFLIASKSLQTAGQVGWGEQYVEKWYTCKLPYSCQFSCGRNTKFGNFLNYLLLKLSGWSSHWETDSRSAGHEISAYYETQRSLSCSHKIAPLASPFCQPIMFCFCKISFSIILSFFTSDFRNKLLYVFFVSPMHIICPAYIFLLNLITQYILLSLVRTVYKPVLRS